MIDIVKYILPELFIVLFTVSYLTISVLSNGKALVAYSNNISAIFLLLASAIVFTQDTSSDPVMNGFYSSNAFTSFFKGLILILSAIILHLSDDYLKKNNLQIFEFPLLANFSIVGMMIIVSANDLLSLYIGIEMQSLSLYIMASFSRDNAKSTEAGLKYFILGALSSGLLLYGISLVYGTTGSTQFHIIYDTIMYSDSLLGLQVGMVFIISSIAFKFSAFPFHMWTPDVYEGAPTPVTALFAIVPKVAAMTLIMNVTYFAFSGISDQWSQILIALSVASMIVGATGAIMQQNIKRMLAYSSIAHMGYALAGLAAGSLEGAAGVVIYMTTYVFMGAGAFSIIMSLRRDDAPVERISDLSGLSSTHPLLAAGMMVVMFSMAGIPPLAGFFGKWYVFLAAVNAGLVPLAIIGVLTSVVGAFYYLRIIKLMYFEDANAPLDEGMSRQNRLVLVASLAFIILFFLGIGQLAGVVGTNIEAFF